MEFSVCGITILVAIVFTILFFVITSQVNKKHEKDLAAHSKEKSEQITAKLNSSGFSTTSKIAYPDVLDALNKI
jgi:hypothetical protein